MLNMFIISWWTVGWKYNKHSLLSLSNSALTINRKLELLLLLQPPPSTRAAITVHRVRRKCKQSHIARFTDIRQPCFLSCLHLSNVESYRDRMIAGRDWLRQAWGGSKLAWLTAIHFAQLLISPQVRWVVRARNMSINRSAVSAIARAVF